MAFQMGSSSIPAIFRASKTIVFSISRRYSSSGTGTRLSSWVLSLAIGVQLFFKGWCKERENYRFSQMGSSMNEFTNK